MTGKGPRTGSNGGPRPPKDLSREAKKLWQRLYDESDIDPVAEVLLDTLCRTWDRLQQARELLAKEGVIISEKTGAGIEKRRTHPAVLVEHNAAATVCRCWRLLGFDQLPPEGV
jgi:P27 family predicted phage terminase small subunit